MEIANVSDHRQYGNCYPRPRNTAWCYSVNAVEIRK